MDFKSMISKIESIDGPINTPKAPSLAEPIRLDEDTELRVLAGVTPLTESVIAEKKLTKAEKEKKETVVKSMKKNKGDFEKRYGEKGEEVMHATATKIAKKTAESVEVDEGFEDKLEKAREKAAAKGKTKEKEKEPTDSKVRNVTGWRNKQKSQDDEEVDEAAKPDFLDIDKDGDKKEPMMKAVADKKKGSAPKKGVNPFAKKKTVKESIEPKLTFKDMVKLVQESGGQQAIDPVDTALFTWAQRVAANKFTESTKAEIYAGLIYERNGGTFEMYDVLSENKK